jgi:3-hydroxyacyl-CoA dehydrogenase
MGPFKLFDYVGLDTCNLIGMSWAIRAAQGLVPESMVDPPSNMIPELVEEGHFGRKTGRGFYDVGLLYRGFVS